MVWHKTIGNGPTKVIVIHGWFWDHRVFTPIFDCLDTASHTYAFVDIRGYGNSRNVSGEYTIGEVAADAIALADQLGWREFHVVGHSMGGKAAQKVAMDAGSRVKSVVAVTPVPASALPFDDGVFGFFAAACEQDERALALMGDSLGNRGATIFVAPGHDNPRSAGCRQSPGDRRAETLCRAGDHAHLVIHAIHRTTS